MLANLITVPSVLIQSSLVNGFCSLSHRSLTGGLQSTSMRKRPLFVAALLLLAAPASRARMHADEGSPLLQFDSDQLEDKIRGGMLAQVIGNLNGLPHEFKYIDQPGSVERYIPGLPDGAHTDDDTDIEWVYLREIARTGQPLL